jgi:hypothetical protein
MSRRRLTHGGALVLGVALACSGRAAWAQTRPANLHGALPRGLDCSACHTAAAWSPLTSPLAFDHGRSTPFPLSGRHTSTPCAGCHLDLRFDGPDVAPTACAACHVDIHQGTLAGPCVQCHTDESFRDVPAITAHARAGFPLTGSHLQAPCESCHRNDQGGAFAAVSRECAACHQSAFLAASAPDHSGFPTDCQACHATFTWHGGVAFDHVTVANGFALVGAHALLRCTSCHVVPGFAPLFSATGQNDCIGCHQSQYDRQHGQQGYPTACVDCHTVNRWDEVTFDHSSRFRLRGPHAVACATCHTTPGNASAFSCFSCHEHSQARVDQHHREVSGYVYDSRACVSCHGR